MNGIKRFFTKKNIIISIACIMASIFILVIIQNSFSKSQRLFRERTIGSINDLSVNMTFKDIDENFSTYNINNNHSEKLNYINYKMGLHFGDDYFLKEYFKKNNISQESFCEKYGFIRGNYQYKDISVYTFSKFTKENDEWNVLIKNKDKYKILKLSDIDPKYSKQNNLSFCLKIQIENEKIYIYLESGLYIIDNEFNIESIKFDANKIFKEISQSNIIPSITRIQYIDNNLYVISADREFNFYLIKYDIINLSYTKYTLNFVPQCIDTLNNEIIILSSKQNRIFIETLNDEKIISKEIKDITNLNLKNFLTQTPVNKLVVNNNKLYFVFSNNNTKNVVYIFCVDATSLNLEGFKEITLKTSKHYLNNTVIYIR